MTVRTDSTTDRRDYFQLYGVPRDAAAGEAAYEVARHVQRRCGRGPAGAYPAALRLAAGRVVAALRDHDSPLLPDLATVLLAVGARSRSGVRVPWRVQWSADKLTRWICAVRRIDPATGIRETSDARG